MGTRSCFCSSHPHLPRPHLGAGRGRWRRGPERVLCLFTSSKIRIKAAVRAPSFSHFAVFLSFSAVLVVCLQLEKVVHLVMETLLLFKQRKLYHFPAIVSNEVILTFLKICSCISQNLVSILRARFLGQWGSRVGGGRMWFSLLKTRFSLCVFKFRDKQEMPLYGTQRGSWGYVFSFISFYK